MESSKWDSDRLLGVRLRQLATLEAVSQEHSFRRAARKLGYSQSAVSQQIASLEQAVGRRLIHRVERARGALTPAGEIVVARARTILAEANAAEAELRTLGAGTDDVVRLGVDQSVAAALLPAVVERIREVAPALDVRLEHALRADLLDGLACGELEFALTVLPIDDERFDTEDALVDEFKLAVRHDARLARVARVNKRALDGLALMCLASCRATDNALEQLRADGIVPRLTFRSDDAGAITALVCAGLGTALLPGNAIRAVPNDVVVRPLTLAPFWRSVGVGWLRRRVLTDNDRTFLAVVRAASAALQQSSEVRTVGAG